MIADAHMAADTCDFFAGLVPMLRGETIPYGNDSFHYTVREPLGVVARIVAYNHPLLFIGQRLAAPLAAGNTVILKPPEQATLSTMRLVELMGSLFPPGVFNILSGGADCGKALTTHPLVKKVTFTGSVPVGISIQKSAAESLKGTILELGGKNALIAYDDADPAKVANAAVSGMNFTWGEC
jgi:betaine-aldehyde dehydrogenase